MPKLSISTCPKYCKLETSFTYKLLVALKLLENTKKFYQGVGLDEIEKFMKRNYSLTGDVRSQIQNSVNNAEESRLVLKKGNGYILLPPAARLHIVPVPCVKAKSEDVQKSFNSFLNGIDNSNVSNKRTSKRKTNCNINHRQKSSER